MREKQIPCLHCSAILSVHFRQPSQWWTGPHYITNKIPQCLGSLWHLCPWRFTPCCKSRPILDVLLGQWLSLCNGLGRRTPDTSESHTGQAIHRVLLELSVLMYALTQQNTSVFEPGHNAAGTLCGFLLAVGICTRLASW